MLGKLQQQGKATFPEDFPTKQPGPLPQARWLTLAKIIMRYIRNHSPAQANGVFVMSQYAPGWFRFKTYWMITDGAPNFMYLIQLSRRLSDIDRQTSEIVLQNNGYRAHSENILLAILPDEDEDTRQMALRTILRCRTSITQSGKQVLQFLVQRSILIRRCTTN